MRRYLRVAGAALAATLGLGIGMASARPDAGASYVSETPPGCNWADFSREEQHLWCPNSEGRFFDTGRVHANVDLPGEAVRAVAAPPPPRYVPPPAEARRAPVEARQTASPPPVARRVAVRPAGSGKSYTRMMLAALEQDSQYWASWMNYDKGSMANVRVMPSDRDLRVRADFTYSGGQPGWIQALVENGEVTCVEYFDSLGQCNPVRRNTGQQPIPWSSPSCPYGYHLSTQMSGKQVCSP